MSIGPKTPESVHTITGPTVDRYTVEFKRLAEPSWMPALFWAWVVFAIPYLAWRVYVVNWDSWVGPASMVPELFTAMLAGLFLGTAQQIHMPVHRPTDLRRWVVDCVIPTHLESADIIECTVLGALRVRGVRSVIVAANLERVEVREVCQRLGVRYVARGSNLYAKAGTLNAGLGLSDADFVMLLDADHIARPEMLERLMGWFDDPAVAFVQGPQLYYNSDSFLFRRFHRVPRGWSEQTMFYQVVQPSKNRWNSVCFVGSSAVMRRAALDSIGGFATGTATEDIHTSIRLHAKGWKGIYTNEPVAYGLEAPSMKEFYTQRRRWAGGSAGLCLRSADSPLRARGLTFMQRLNYFNSTISHVLGPLRAVQILLPMLCLVTLMVPVHVNVASFIVVSLAFFVYSGFLSWIYSRGAMHFIHNEAYLYGNHVGMSFGMLGLVRVQRKFISARKNASRFQRTWVRWYLWAIALAGFLAGGYGLWQIASGVRTPVVVWSTFFVLANQFWILWFLVPLMRYELRSRHEPLPPYQTLTGVDRYNWILNHMTGRFTMPSGVVVNHPVKTTRVRPVS